MSCQISVLAFIVATLTLTAVPSGAFYIPGMNPIGYTEGDVVPVIVNGLHSINNVIPYDYYYGPFCRPNVIVSRHESIGQILSGENQRSSPYYFNMLYDNNCKAITCNSMLDDQTASLLEDLIEKEYRGFMVVDNLPAFKNATPVFQGRCQRPFRQIPYQRGYALGVPKACTGDETLINNHLHFRIQYHRVDRDQYFSVADTDIQDGLIAGQTKKEKRKKQKAGEDEEIYLVVGVTVEPFSIQWPNVGEDFSVPSCTLEFDPYSASNTPLTTKYRGRIAWTYGVTFVEEPNIRWASRWDSYLKTSVADTNNRIHWLSIMNTILIVVCLISTIFVAIVRVLRKDIARYNLSFEMTKDESREVGREESGWKMVAGDVFRTPRHHVMLTIGVASGCQVLSMVASTLCISLFGFLSPAMRGGFMTALLLFFVLCSALAGYVAARMHIKLGGEKSWPLVFKVGSLLPGSIFFAFTVCNALLRSVRSSGSVPFLTLLSLLTLWLLVAIPLALVGASYGFRALPQPNPKKTNAIPRPIDPVLAPALFQNNTILLLSGILPLAAMFLELRFILASVWQGVVYYVFGFLTVVFILWAATSAMVSIVITYYKLCSENYHWWWVSFLAPSSGGLHLFLFLTYYFFSSLTITSSIATIIYFIYMALATFAYVLAGGAVGLLCSWAFTLKIYGSVKTE